jgi:hypothetical protein
MLGDVESGLIVFGKVVVKDGSIVRGDGSEDGS